MPKISPLYNLIIELKHENNSLANPFLLKKTSRNYFLLKLTTEIQPIINRNYKLEEAHFSIDEQYNHSQHGYTPIHYTQTYFCESENDYIVIHGYLDAQGKYLYSQAKKLNDQKIFTGTFFDLTTDQETLLKTQIAQFTPLLIPLFNEKTSRQKILKKQSDHLDIELTSLSQSFGTQETHTQYIQKAHEFIATVQKLNRYSEMQDDRDLLMLHMIQQIEKINACIQRNQTREFSTLDPTQENPETKTEAETKAETEAETIESIENLYINAITAFNSAVQSFQACNPDLLQEKNQLAAIIHEQLLIFYYFPENLITKKDKQKITKTNDNIKKFYQSQVDELKQQALKGNIEIVQKRFPIYLRYITRDFYESLVNSLLEKKWNNVQANILAICDYLNENDDRYRNYIFDITQKKEYAVSNHMIENFIKNTSLTKKDENNGRESYQASLLFQLHLKNEKLLFETFLHHGASSDTWGIKSNVQKKAPFTLFYNITGFKSANYLKYLKILLQHQADPNAIFTQEMITHQNQQRLKKAKTICEIKSPIRAIFPQVSLKCTNLDSFFSPVQLLSSVPDLDIWRLVTPKASLANLALCFIHFSDNVLTRKIPIPASCYGTSYANSKKEAHDYGNQAAQAQSNVGIFLHCVLYPDPKNDLEKMKETNEIYEKMKLIDQIVVQKLSTLNPDEFANQYQAFFKLGEEEFAKANHCKQKNKFQYVLNYFEGCEYLLMKYTQLSIHPTDQRSFIQKYDKSRYDYIISSMEAFYSKEEAKLRTKIYRTIRDSLTKKYTTASTPLLIKIQKFENLSTPNKTIIPLTITQSPPMTQTKTLESKIFLVNHYQSVPVYTEQEFNKPIKPKKTN